MLCIFITNTYKWEHVQQVFVPIYATTCRKFKRIQTACGYFRSKHKSLDKYTYIFINARNWLCCVLKIAIYCKC